MRNSKDGCTFPPNISAPTPNSLQNFILGDILVQTLLQRELSVSRTLIELRSWNVTAIGIGKYFMVCQNFSVRGHPGGAGPLM